MTTQISFRNSRNPHLSEDFHYVDLQNLSGKVTVSLLSGQVIFYEQWGKDPVVWGTEERLIKKGAAINGGLPVTFPRCGPHPDGSSLTTHGLVGDKTWEKDDFRLLNNKNPQITLTTSDTPETRNLWPHRFKLSTTITLSRLLTISLTITNTDRKPFAFSNAMLGYFFCGGRSRAAIYDLDNYGYYAKLAKEKPRVQLGSTPVNMAINNLYNKEVREIKDPVFNRVITISKTVCSPSMDRNPCEPPVSLADASGSSSLVSEESGNTYNNVVTLNPSSLYEQTTTISTKSLA